MEERLELLVGNPVAVWNNFFYIAGTLQQDGIGYGVRNEDSKAWFQAHDVFMIVPPIEHVDNHTGIELWDK